MITRRLGTAVELFRRARGNTPNRKQGTRYTDGLLFGTVSRRQGTETKDDHERRTTVHREACEYSSTAIESSRERSGQDFAAWEKAPYHNVRPEPLRDASGVRASRRSSRCCGDPAAGFGLTPAAFDGVAPSGRCGWFVLMERSRLRMYVLVWCFVSSRADVCFTSLPLCLGPVRISPCNGC